MTSFHDEPTTSDFGSPTKQRQHTEAPVKVNPLAKHKSKKSTDDYPLQKLNYFGASDNVAHRKSSVSSDEINVRSVMNDMVDVATNASSSSADKFDSWVSDTNQRRSPEGGEDLSSQMACTPPEPDQSFEAEKVKCSIEIFSFVSHLLKIHFIFSISLTRDIKVARRKRTKTRKRQKPNEMSDGSERRASANQKNMTWRSF